MIPIVNLTPLYDLTATHTISAHASDFFRQMREAKGEAEGVHEAMICGRHVTIRGSEEFIEALGRYFT